MTDSTEHMPQTFEGWWANTQHIFDKTAAACAWQACEAATAERIRQLEAERDHDAKIKADARREALEEVKKQVLGLSWIPLNYRHDVLRQLNILRAQPDSTRTAKEEK